MRAHGAWVGVWVAWTLAACAIASEPPPDDAGHDAARPPPPRTNDVDLLLMIDDSNATSEQQDALARSLPRLLGVLASGHDASGAVPDFVPVDSIHVGIVSSDLGVGAVTGIASCTSAGDDGVMTVRSHAPVGCDVDNVARYPHRVFAFDTEMPDVAALAADVACVARLGTDGCNFESELEAPLEALSLRPTATGDSPVAWTATDYRPPLFREGAHGHGDDPTTNGAFLRPGSVLAIVLVADEDDCSTPTPEIYSPDDPRFPSSLSLRCFAEASALYPIARYVDGFAGLRAEPERLVFAVVGGVPIELAGREPSEILADPRMRTQLDPVAPAALAIACTAPGGRGVAVPAMRMTQVAAGLAARGARTTVQSICDPDYGAVLATIVDALR